MTEPMNNKSNTVNNISPKKYKIVVKKKVTAKKQPQSTAFRLIDFHVCDDKNNENIFTIQMFGLNEKGETCSITVDDFNPFFFVKVADNWTQANAVELMNYMEGKIQHSGVANNNNNKSIVNAELVSHNKLYGFTSGKKYKFVKFTFKNMSCMNRMKNLWYTYNKNNERVLKEFLYPPKSVNKVSLELYEAGIPPILRYFHINNVSPSGWISVTSLPVSCDMKRTTCTFEFVCKSRQVKPLNEKETRVPYKICSVDIEASSSHGDFPLPKKTYKKLATNLVDVFANQFATAKPETLDEPQKTKMNSYLKKCIVSSFAPFPQQMDGIDVVYPKNPLTKKQLGETIDMLLSSPIKSLFNQPEDAELKNIMTITNMFEKIHKANGIGGGGDDEDGAECGEDGDAEIEIEEPECNDDNDVESDEEEEMEAPKKPKKTSHQQPQVLKNPAIKSTHNVVNVLLDNTLKRDEKIQTLNEIMTRMFPRLKGDEVTFIGSTFMRYGEPEPYFNHCLVVGSCDTVEGAVIETADNEKNMLLQWTDLMQRENPDIIIGYNTFGFDYEFMFRRAEETHCEKDFLKLSRNVDELSGTLNYNTNEVTIENTKIMLASGEYDLRYYKMSGRLQIDMYSYFRRDFNLSSYKLDDVAGQYISDSIIKTDFVHDEQHGEVTELHSKNLTGLHVNDYIHIEITGFTADYYKDGKKFKVLSIEPVEGCNGVKKITIQGHEHDIKNHKNIKWCIAKDDVTPQDIFRLSKGSSADRAIVAKYCIQDCNLVHHLMNKIDVVTGYVEMSKICSVPISYLVFRGQGIKLTSYVAKKCREKDTLMPDLAKSHFDDGYEGAIVLPPKCSMYMDNPVACVDYSSLYPSSMISQNLCPSSKVWTKEYDLTGRLIREFGERDANGGFIYDNLPNYQYIDIEFDLFKYLRDPNKPSAKAKKTKTGRKVCRWAQYPDNKKAIMPSILEELLKARSDTRKLAKTVTDPFMQNILDKRQLGYKVTANSLYGQCGSRTSTFYEKDVAASTTATGRMMILYAKKIIEEVYCGMNYETEHNGTVLTNAEYVYGDSVASYTPVYVRNTNKHQFHICKIEEIPQLFSNNCWRTCMEVGKQEKEVCELNDVETWTEKGWTKLHRVIRHHLAPHKKMVRVMTHTGLVDVTDDHSLLTPVGKSITPNEVHIGTELMHHDFPTPPLLKISNDEFSINEAYFAGLHFGKEHIFKINTNTPNDYSLNKIINSSRKIREEFWFGLCVSVNFNEHCIYLKEQTTANQLCWLASSLGWNTLLTVCENDVYKINITGKNATIGKIHITFCDNGQTCNEQLQNPNAIKKIHNIDYSGYVYDLTTVNHHFSAGIGNMVVHNTDSVFFTFNLKDPVTMKPIVGEKALEITIEIAQDAAKLCSKWLKPPMELSYEKTLMPFILLSKKRYVGMLYETDPNKGKIKYMGLSLKRRDSCDYLKDVYGGILNILMKEQNIQKSIDYLNQSMNQLVFGKVNREKLIITKSLRSDYKNPKQIAHKVLADRIAQRDPGNKPKSGDRIGYIVIVNNNKKALQGERIETPEFIEQQKLTIDYTFYITNQLMKPLQQLFGLALEQIWRLNEKQHRHELKNYQQTLNTIMSECENDLELFAKKKEKFCSQKIKVLLFQDTLTIVDNQLNNMKSIKHYFSKA